MVVCGNPDCREEYHARTDEKVWTCPKCGRTKTNDYWPFLDARLMQAMIDKDWKKVVDDIIARARRMVEDKETETAILKKDLEALKNQREAERSSG